MDWTESIDRYCERTDPGFWAEPLNALSNVAFLVAAAYGFALWRRRGGGDPVGLFFTVLTAVVGIGSLLFHTYATRWAAAADVGPIALFVLSYFLLAMRRFVGLDLLAAVAATLAFAVAAVVVGRLGEPLLGTSAGYLPALAALAGIGLGLRPRLPGIARRLLDAAQIFTVSLFVRTIDEQLCSVLPFGTHFLWHIMNGALLALLTRTAIETSLGDRKRRP